MLYRSIVREMSQENREKLDTELLNPGHKGKQLQKHRAVQADPELGLRLQYQDRIKAAKTQAGQQRLTDELRDKLIELRRTQAAEKAVT